MRNYLLIPVLVFSFLFAPLVPAFADDTAVPPTDPAPAADTGVAVPDTTDTVDISSTTPVVTEDPTSDTSTTTSDVLPPQGPSVAIDEASTTDASTTPSNGTVTLTIRYGENVAWSGSVPLPAAGTADITPTDGGAPVSVDADSLLAVLTNLDTQSDAFDITKLQYFPSFGEFIIDCISAQSFSEACDQWQYVVDGSYPFVGIDQTVLHDGDTVYLYFGSPRRVTVPSAATVGQPFTTTAESYDPSDNTYHPLPDYTVGVTQPNPDDPFSPIEVATSTTAADGTASFTIAQAGSYGVGLKEDFYFPLVPLTISSTTAPGGGDGGNPSGPEFSTPNAFSFLVSQQSAGGDLGSDIVTDWGAVAFAATGAPADAKDALAQYLRDRNVRLSSALDYERHAMALEALGISPYSGGRADYITPIVNDFDGTQVDDPSLVNDDIFAIFPLLHAGYSTKDDIIAKTAAFIISKQRSDGSWDESSSLTAAGIQALTLVSTVPGATGATTLAEGYLHSVQKADGSFGDATASDPFATSWALQAIKALGESPSDWAKNGKTPLDYLATDQQTDGGVQTSPNDATTRAWGTAYAIVGAKGLTWNSLLHGFSKPKAAGSTGTSPSKNTDDTATTTPNVTPIATTTDAAPFVATSTPALNVVTMVPTITPSTTSSTFNVPSFPRVLGESTVAPHVDATSSSTTTDTSLTAAAADAPGASWLAELWHGFWQGLMSLLGKIF